MRTHGSAKELEQRRLRAVRMVVKDGLSVTEVSRRVKADRRTVTRWMEVYRRDGETGLHAKPHPGRSSFLDVEQKADLRKRLINGALAEGFTTDLWTCSRVQQLIARQYGVQYHVDHMPRLLKSLGFTPQKPERRAIERDEQAIDGWITKDWPRIKKRPADLVLT